MGKALDEQLIIAIKQEDTERAVKLVSKGADINSTDAHGNSPLVWAIALGNEPMIEEFIRQGADDTNEKIAGFMMCQSTYGDKKLGSLIYALSEGLIAIAGELVRTGVDLKTKSPRIKAALAKAMENAFEEGKIDPKHASAFAELPGAREILIKSRIIAKRRKLYGKSKKKVIAKKIVANKKAAHKKTSSSRAKKKKKKQQ